MKKIILNLLLLFVIATAIAQQKAENPYGLPIMNSLQQYRAAIKQNPDLELVEIKKAIPSIQLDIRYASTNNFMQQVMYAQARAFARKPVVQQLKKIQAELKKQGYGLKIYDAYRPYAVTLAFYDKASDKSFVANPKQGSKHNRGCAVDLSLIDLKTGQDVPMPTPYDSFEAAASPDYQDLQPDVIRNRDFLIAVMHKHGFRVIKNEWWHFDFVGWQNFSLMDIPFEQL